MILLRCLALSIVAAAIAFTSAPLPAAAQNLFSPVATVNDRIVTAYEVDQRARLLTLLRAPGDVKELALEQLIEDRLRLDAMAASGIVPSDEEIAAGMEEFAGRANLSTDEFLATIAGAGVDPETFREFIRPGIGWREVVRARFVPRTRITEAEIDRAIAQSSRGGGIRVLLNEIILPNVPQVAAQSQRQAAQIARVTTISRFQSLARQYSVAPSRANGGRLDWLPLSNLPPQLRTVVLALQPGEVSAPVPLPNAILFFQLRDIEETDALDAEIAAVEYAAYYMPKAAEAKAQTLKGKVDTCDDLYGIAKGQPEDVLERSTLPPAEIPQDVALELAKLDPGEVSTSLRRAEGETLVFLMLCGRTPAIAEGQEVDRETVRQSLTDRRLASFADGYLEELRADAIISLTP